MQNCTFLVLLRPIFAEKMKTVPPPKKFGCWSREVVAVIRPEKPFNFRFWPKNPSQFRWRPFFFWRTPVFGLKDRLNFRVRPKSSSQFRWRPFFFEITCFWAEKPLYFWFWPKYLCFVWFLIKILIQEQWNFGQGCLQLSHSFKKAPPPFFKSWLRAWLKDKNLAQ